MALKLETRDGSIMVVKICSNCAALGLNGPREFYTNRTPSFVVGITWKERSNRSYTQLSKQPMKLFDHLSVSEE